MTLYESNSLIVPSNFEEMRLRFQDALRDSYIDMLKPKRIPEIGKDVAKHEDAFEYIAKMMTAFMVSDNLAAPEGMKIETLTERLMRIPHRSKLIADFGLFVSGMFPEFLARKNLSSLYEDCGTAFYRQLHEKTRYPTYDKLSWKFSFYQNIITNMRNMYTEPPYPLFTTYDGQRWKGIFDGEWRYEIENAAPFLQELVSKPWKEN